MKEKEINGMNESEFYRIIIDMNSKIDKLLERTVSKDDCYNSRINCNKDNIQPLKAFMYKIIGAMVILNLLFLYYLRLGVK